VCTSAPQPVQLNRPGGRPWFLSCVAWKLSPHFGQMKTTVVCTPLTIAPSCAPTHPVANTRLEGPQSKDTLPKVDCRGHGRAPMRFDGCPTTLPAKRERSTSVAGKIPRTGRVGLEWPRWMDRWSPYTAPTHRLRLASIQTLFSRVGHARGTWFPMLRIASLNSPGGPSN
jgi:hypothetical protein